jgi:uncharacterized membrane protein
MADTTTRPEAAHDTVSPERLIYFSDAVIAIAITLLALELPVPTGNVHGDGGVLEFLREHSAEYLAFLISFAAVAMQWLAHQRLFRYATGLAGPVIQWNLLWLLMIVLMPFTTKLLTSEADAFEVQFTVYASGQALAGLFLLLAFSGLRRNGLLRTNASPEVIANTTEWMTAVVVMFALSIPVAFATHWSSLCWLLLPVVRMVLRSLRRRPSAETNQRHTSVP